MTAYSTVTMEQAQERMKTLREFFQTVRLLEADEIQGELKASALEGEDSSCGHCYDYWKKAAATAFQGLPCREKRRKPSWKCAAPISAT